MIDFALHQHRLCSSFNDRLSLPPSLPQRPTQPPSNNDSAPPSTTDSASLHQRPTWTGRSIDFLPPTVDRSSCPPTPDSSINDRLGQEDRSTSSQHRSIFLSINPNLLHQRPIARQTNDSLPPTIGLLLKSTIECSSSHPPPAMDCSTSDSFVINHKLLQPPPTPPSTANASSHQQLSINHQLSPHE
ncbi:hypothetical protein M409DRAFT_52440 [Zasmidium cellare ATCC 36951]|uniref:Uncharacterized protein n=1 Tax=Zasmidium cellare ATCC 36951 TaxID=1080233 RepID=A0A6A6CPF2_ZASCE|nr:uncharacterized protein M409DRAFT_52440 [Zasmidium cellare ATCC 36951]KAF2169157.1 hypothetical protein M409DRAFT_52440 [Zasmidium cellare ATCC 36951]